jgi:hypothetical protein
MLEEHFPHSLTQKFVQGDVTREDTYNSTTGCDLIPLQPNGPDTEL